MEQKRETDAELMKRLQETGARMYHPMRQLVLCEPVEDGWRAAEPDDEMTSPGVDRVSRSHE